MRRRVVVMVVVASLAGCGSPAASTRTPPGPPPESPCSSTGSAGPVRPDPVVAMLVSQQGVVCWQQRLPTANISSQPGPVVSDTLAYFAVGSQVEAVRLTDGRPAWTWSGHPVEGTPGLSPYALGLDGMWLGGGVLAVSEAATVIGLDALSGAVRWRFQGQSANDAVPTADGGLAMYGPGESIAMLDLASGHVRWSSPNGSFAAVATGVVLVRGGGRIQALDDQSGAVRWAWTSPFGDTHTTHVRDGLVLVGYVQAPVMIALDPGSGQERWRFQAAGGVWESTTGPAGVAVDVGPYNTTTELALLDPQTGVARWRQPAVALHTPALAGRDLVGISETWSNQPTILVDRSTDDGKLRWQRQVPPATSATLFGSLVTVEPVPTSMFRGPVVAHRLSDGGEAWQLDMAGGTVQVATAVVVPEGLLIEAAQPSNLASLGH